MNAIGRTVQVASITLGVAVFLAAAWPLGVGGVADLASTGPLSTGIGALDGLDEELRADWGEHELGLLKLLVLLPIAVILAAVIARGGVALGRSLRARARPAAPRPQRLAAPRPAVAPPPGQAAATVAPPPPVEPAPPRTPPSEPVASPPEAEPAAAPAAGDLPAPVGAGVTLHGVDRVRTIVEVTVEDVQTLSGELPGLAAGDRLLSVLVRLRNVGAGTYVDYPTGGARIVCADGTLLRPSRHRREPALREVRLEPGEELAGHLTFELPENAEVLSVRFALDVGVASESAAWDLTASAAA